MGKEHKRKGKYFFFHRASLIAILMLSFGCTTTWIHQGTWEMEMQLNKAEELAFRGNFEDAFRRDEEIVKLFPHTTPGDRAIFHMGLILAHPDNPKQDYGKSLKCFKKILKNFPESPLKINAEICAYTITQVIRDYRTIKRLRKRIGSLKTQIKGYTETINILKGQLEKIKEIDIITEEKKRVRSSGD